MKRCRTRVLVCSGRFESGERQLKMGPPLETERKMSTLSWQLLLQWRNLAHSTAPLPRPPENMDIWCTLKHRKQIHSTTKAKLRGCGWVVKSGTLRAYFSEDTKCEINVRLLVNVHQPSPSWAQVMPVERRSGEQPSTRTQGCRLPPRRCSGCPQHSGFPGYLRERKQTPDASEEKEKCFFSHFFPTGLLCFSGFYNLENQSNIKSKILLFPSYLAGETLFPPRYNIFSVVVSVIRRYTPYNH